jgi:phosphopantothenoylcysteine decarboxylase/phosphopantothenate--cysteine ligase
MRGKTILLGVTGGIAVYKAAALTSKLTQAGADVRVIMTESATKFVTPLTFQTLSRNPVATDVFDERDPSAVQHIDLADAADLLVVAPATANIIAKMARGIADDMLSTTYLATTAPVLVAPAMNVHMYAHPAVQENLDILRRRGVTVMEPGEGQLACGYTGRGRMPEPEELAAKIAEMLADGPADRKKPAEAKPEGGAADGPMKGLRVLVTAGGTVERIDAVRYLSNDSSGRMGFAFAEAARDMGAEVTLVKARTDVAPPPGVTVVEALTAEDMLSAVLARYPDTDLVIKAAAVADYRPANPAAGKIKKTAERLTLELEKTPDILQALGERKTTQFLIGFAAETERLAEYATDKAVRKNCDLVVGNDVTVPGAGFGTETNKVVVADQKGVVAELPLMSKRETAERVLALALERMKKAGGGKRT